jgi:hypothetical protein
MRVIAYQYNRKSLLVSQLLPESFATVLTAWRDEKSRKWIQKSTIESFNELKFLILMLNSDYNCVSRLGGTMGKNDGQQQIEEL